MSWFASMLPFLPTEEEKKERNINPKAKAMVLAFRNVMEEIADHDVYLRESGMIPQSGAAVDLVELLRDLQDPWSLELIRRYDAIHDIMENDAQLWKEYVELQR